MYLRAFLVLLVGTFVSACSATPHREEQRVPEIMISYGYYLDQMIAGNLPDGVAGRFPPLSSEEIAQGTVAFDAEWREHEKKILTAMQNILGLEFQEESISVYLISRNNGGLSEPLIVSLRYKEKTKAGVLAHELAHRLLARNTKGVSGETICDSMFHGEHELTRSHVVEFAVLVHIFNDVLNKPEMLTGERNVEHPAYRRAWDIVDQKGYKEIIKEFRSHYE
jgi:hypothetical protein